jgi:ammonia channel protein AmtB
MFLYCPRGEKITRMDDSLDVFACHGLDSSVHGEFARVNQQH